MKINEVLKEAGNFNFATTKATGRNYFLNSVTNQIYAYIDSVSESGAPLQIWEFVNAYMAKYGWTANPQQEQLLKGLSKKVEDEYNEVGQHPAPGQPQQAQQQQTTTQNPAQNAIAQKRLYRQSQDQQRDI